MVVTCSLTTLIPLIYLFFIRDYFSIVASMSDPMSQVRGEYVCEEEITPRLSLLKNDDLEMAKQSRVYVN